LLLEQHVFVGGEVEVERSARNVGARDDAIDLVASEKFDSSLKSGT